MTTNSVGVGEGIQFPRDEEGRTSTTALGRAVVAAAARPLDPALARAIEAERDWRRRNGVHIAALEGGVLARGEVAASVAAAGLTALHERFRFVRDGESMAPAQAMDRF